MGSELARIDPRQATAEQLQQYAVAIREPILACTDQDALNAIEAILVAVAKRLRQLGQAAGEAERSRLLALSRLGELLGPAVTGPPRKITSPDNDVTPAPLPRAERDRRHLARALAKPENKPILDAELSREKSSPSRVMRLIQRERATERVPMPERRYAILLADPPWRYDGAEAANRQIENQYPAMSLDAIKALPVPAARDAVLFLWATSPKLPEAFAVMQAWGFAYRTCAVWVKDKIGMGYYFRQQHELLLVGKRGEPPVPAPENRAASVFYGDRTEHSAKPGAVFELIEGMYPEYDRSEDLTEFCELFQREPRKGWAGWGNEAAQS